MNSVTPYTGDVFALGDSRWMRRNLKHGIEYTAEIRGWRVCVFVEEMRGARVRGTVYTLYVEGLSVDYHDFMMARKDVAMRLLDRLLNGAGEGHDYLLEASRIYGSNLGGFEKYRQITNLIYDLIGEYADRDKRNILVALVRVAKRLEWD